MSFPVIAFTFTFGEDSMLSSAEAVITFGPVIAILQNKFNCTYPNVSKKCYCIIN